MRTGTVLATIVDVSRLRLRFKVSEGESLRAARGRQGHLPRGAARAQRDFGAHIYHVGDVADPQTRQVEVLAWVKNPGELKPGFFAEVTLAGEKKQGALVVPESAIQASERGFVAYVVEEKTARVRAGRDRPAHRHRRRRDPLRARTPARSSCSRAPTASPTAWRSSRSSPAAASEGRAVSDDAD